MRDTPPPRPRDRSLRQARLRAPASIVALVLLPCLTLRVGAQRPGSMTAAAAGSTVAAPVVQWQSFTFETRAHGAMPAELGVLTVPVRHADPSGPTRILRFVRLRATAQPATAAPVIYLAGGPGGSGIDAARGSRWPVFDAVRGHSDLILLDQRGTGRSDPPPACPAPADPPLALDIPLQDPAPLQRAVEEDVARCVAFWRAAGVDLGVYTTEESADDVEAIRAALGVPKVSLWGMSYGTHLALSVLRRHGARVERTVLMGTEGPDHTLKRPSAADTVLARVHAWAATDTVARTMTPDLIGTIDQLLVQLGKQPAIAEVPGPDGRMVRVAIGRFDLQRVVALALGRTQTASLLPPALGMLAAGDASLVARLLLPIRMGAFPRTAMPLAMDVASGASVARRRLTAAESRTSRLGEALLAPTLHDIRHLPGVPDLSDRFRQPVMSRVPTLFVSGTLDARTPPNNAEDVRAGFRKAWHLVLAGAGHDDDLWTSTPVVAERVAAFFAGRAVAGDTVTVDLLRVPNGPPR